MGSPFPFQIELTVIEDTLTVDTGDHLVTVVGEALNESDFVVGLIQLAIAGLDAGGELVGTGSGWTQGGTGVSSLWLPSGSVAPGETVWFTATIQVSQNRPVATVLVSARGRGVQPAKNAPPILEMIGDWQVESDGWLHTLTGVVRNTGDEDVVGLSAAVALRAPTGELVDLSRQATAGHRINGYLGGVRAGGTAEVETAFWIDPDVFDSAATETRLNAYLIGDERHLYGVIGVAHRRGLGGTSWRSSLSLVNRSGAAGRARLTYRHAEGSESVWVDLEEGEAGSWDDAAVELFGVDGESAGVVLVTSSTPLTVSGRTSNEGPEGGYGQSLPVVTPSMSYGFRAETGRTGILSMLRGAGGFRTNIGLVNMGNESCSARVRIFDEHGGFVTGWGWVELARTEWRQVNRAVPDTMGTAYAVVEREPGCPIWAYASVIDEATGDPTTVPFEPWTEVNLWTDSPRGAVAVIPWAEGGDDPLPP